MNSVLLLFAILLIAKSFENLNFLPFGLYSATILVICFIYLTRSIKIYHLSDQHLKVRTLFNVKQFKLTEIKEIAYVRNREYFYALILHFPSTNESIHISRDSTLNFNKLVNSLKTHDATWKKYDLPKKLSSKEKMSIILIMAGFILSLFISFHLHNL